YLSSGVVQALLTPFKSCRDPGRALSVGELMTESMRAWPEEFRRGKKPSPAAWCEIIRHPASWTDMAFMMGCVHCFSVCCAITGVDDLGVVRPMLLLEPTSSVTVRAWIEMGCWVNRHFVAVANVSVEQGIAGEQRVRVEAGNPSQLTEELKEWGSFDWPLRTVSECQRLLECRYIRPTILVGMEFTGALRAALEAQGKIALSVDYRAYEAGGMHYLGDVRDIVGLQLWEAAYFSPPCFQQLRRDEDCLAYKLADRRAFWGMVFVLWCFACPNALSVCVEQPDTVVPDFIDLGETAGACVREFTTDNCGDAERKFVRLSCRNLSLPPQLAATPARHDPDRSQFNFADAEQRDRYTSSWLRETMYPQPLTFSALLQLFLTSWAATGLPTPEGANNSDGQPSSKADRDYQKVRGVGSRATRGGEDDASGADPLTESLAPSQVEVPPPVGVNLSSAGEGEGVSNECDAENFRLSDSQSVDLRLASKCTAVVLLVSVLVQPFILAHVSGMRTLGVILPLGASRPQAMKHIQKLVSELFGQVQIYSFMRDGAIARCGGALAEADEELESWIAALRPTPLHEIPHSLLTSLADFSDRRLDRVELPLIRPPNELPWVPLPPPTRGRSGPPVCPLATDMLLPEGWARLTSWVEAQVADLLHIRGRIDAGVAPDLIQRAGRLRPIAIGQSEFRTWARGVVWDCRQACCTPLDFSEIPDSGLDRARMAEWCTVTTQIRFSSPICWREFAWMLMWSYNWSWSPTSPPSRWVSPRSRKSYDGSTTFDGTTSSPPFPPNVYCNGQGAVARKLEPDRFRRSTEGGGPRRLTVDASGLPAISLNEASRVPHIPQHFLRDEREEFRGWLRHRGLVEAWMDAREGKLMAWDTADSEGRRRSKWPREHKPTVADLMRLLAVLNRAAFVLEEPLYIFGDDIKDYFNQLAIATSELWKLGILFLRRPEDLLEHSSTPTFGEDALFISELRLGFGTHGASNVAQRFSDALMDRFRDLMDEAEATAPPTRNLKEWLRVRRGMEEPGGEPCHYTRRWAKNVSGGERLYGSLMYIDDPIFVVVGVERAIRALRAWREVTSGLRLVYIMAIPEKRTLGSWVLWLGVLIFAPLGIVVIPRAKLLRARAVIAQVLRCGCHFHVYRSLCGLLEHFRGVNLEGRNIMHGMYRPHGPDGASKYRPQGWVMCDDLMRKQLTRWLTLVLHSAGVIVKRAIARETLEPPPTTVQFVLDSDAAMATSPSQG
ncbi:MAG: hypothetical protein SGPRY_003197, partial [Prymnesium sp.]